MRTRLLTAVAVILTSAAHAQEPVKSPTQEETLAKWPWAISLHPAPFKRESIEIKLAPKEGMEYKYRLDNAPFPGIHGWWWENYSRGVRRRLKGGRR